MEKNNNNRYPNAGLSILIAILGFIGIVMAMMLVGDKVIDIISKHEKAIMAGFFAIVIGILAYSIIKETRRPKRSNYNKLADGRTMIEAKIVDVEKSEDSEMISRVIVAEGVNPKTGEMTVYRSKPSIYFIVRKEELEGKTVPVFVSNKNPEKYIVDISDIEIEAWEKQHMPKEKMQIEQLKEVDKVERETIEDPIAYKERKKKDLIVGVIVFIAGIGLAILALQILGGAWMINQATKDMEGFRISNGKTTNAIIKSVTTTYNPEENVEEHTVIVEYEVDGKKYEENLHAYAEEYKKGLEIEIIYNSKDPTKIMPSWGRIFTLVLLIPLVQGVVVALLAIAMMLFGIKIIKRE